MKTIYVSSKTELDALYNESALTWEGLTTDEENLNDVKNWLSANGAIIEGKEPIFHIITGELMNDTYGLTDTNAYDDELAIVSVTNINSMAVCLARFSVGGRWFDDIVDNNARREKSK